MAITTPATGFVKWFGELGLGDVAAVGGKNASLGEMYRALSPAGVPVPNGFAITTDAYRRFTRGLRLAGREGSGEEARRAILAVAFPSDLEEAIVSAYARLGGGKDATVAVRSSATAEDLPEASFAGQQESFLNVTGREALLDACRRCFASLYTDRAVSYRAHQGVDEARIALSIGVQLMVRSDLACSGVMFTLDTETGFRDAVLIDAAYGLGESIVQGAVNPDEYIVFKPALKAGFRPILQKTAGSKKIKIVYAAGGTRSAPVPPSDRERFAAGDEDILTLARWACAIEEHYSAKKGQPCPMDIEWAKDGLTGKLYIVQARPETVQSRRRTDFIETYRLERRGPVLAEGHSVGGKIACGKARVIMDASRLGELRDGEVLVTGRTDPDWEPIMKKAAAIVTDRGGRTCHAAIVSRELGLPAVVGAETATAAIKDGDEVTVSCAEGETGFVYGERLPFAVERSDLKGLAKPRTDIMLNAADPREAFALARIPNSGVGLARMEFIVTNAVRVHPMALVHPERVADEASRAEIARLTALYEDKPAYFVDKLAEGAGMLAAAFYPKPVILRLSDFKTNEYAGLLGGAAFEPREENPMLGFRGASRYYHPRYREGFALECRAMRKVRETMGLKNLKLMIPFCRTVEEGKKVLAEMEKHGLKRGENGLEVYVMCEIPSNVILAAEFAKIFDGFSIGSNDLTQLILGVDRDSEIVAPLFDERDAAVKAMIASVIRAAKAAGRKIGICGQAPSDYPEFARFLVEEGIDSISLNPDAALRTTLAVLEMERELAVNVQSPGS
ncbi:MAG: phosphoenolpyruvate synthase [Elusimicrobiota bacterium]|nr:phosphoenolpyruvate synthase [Elusimicrobiota bacterium]